MACSRNARNLISELHRISGFGVRPAWYSRRNSANTRSRYSAAKLTTSTSMPIRSATLITSIRSWRDEQYSSVSSSSQFFMNRPITFQPCCFSSIAAAEESTPPDKPTTTVFSDIGSSPFLPFIQRQDHRRETIIHKPAIDRVTPGLAGFPLFDHGRPMHRNQPGKIPGLRLQHAMPAQVAAIFKQPEQARGRGRMIDAIQLARHIVVGVVAAAIIADLRLVACPAIEQSNNVGQRFFLIFGIDRSKQHPAHIAQLPLGVADAGLYQAAVSMADRHRFIGPGTSSQTQTQGQQPPAHQS